MNSLEYCFKKLSVFISLNPYVLKPQQVSIYTYATVLYASLGFPDTFGLPTKAAMAYVGMKDHEAYFKYFKGLAAAGLFSVIKNSVNQYTSNIITMREISELSTLAKRNNGEVSTATTRNNSEASKITHRKSSAVINSKNKNNNYLKSKPATGIIDINKNWCAEFPPEKPPIIKETVLLNNITNGENTARESILPSVAQGLSVPTIEDHKRNALADNNFTAAFTTLLDNIQTLPQWLTVFNNQLRFTNNTMRTEREYREHFFRWLQKIPDSKTMSPFQYNMAHNTAPDTRMTKTEAEFLEIRKRQQATKKQNGANRMQETGRYGHT